MEGIIQYSTEDSWSSVRELEEEENGGYYELGASLHPIRKIVGLVCGVDPSMERIEGKQARRWLERDQ